MKKTQVLYQPQIGCQSLLLNEEQPNITVDNLTLKNVETFTYLGSSLSSKANIDAEITHRLQAAGAAVGKLQTRVFNNNDIYKSTKFIVYKAVVLPTLLYVLLYVQCFIRTNTWEVQARDRTSWRSTIHRGSKTFEEQRRKKREEKRAARKARQSAAAATPATDASASTCPHCNKTCRSRIGLLSHLRTHR